MAITDRKLKDSDIAAKGVVAAPTILNGTPEENKKIFDRLIREAFQGEYNSLIDALVALGVERLIQYGSESMKHIRLRYGQAHQRVSVMAYLGGGRLLRSSDLQHGRKFDAAAQQTEI